MIEALQGSDLSVHLFGAYASREIDGQADVTYPRRQAELAGDYARSRLIWLPGDLDLTAVEDASHRSFLENLERDQTGDGDFIRGLRADLAAQILDKIDLLRTEVDAATTHGDGASCLLVTHTKDTASMLPVAETLMAGGFKAYINQEANEPKTELELFEDRLRAVATLIIFYGQVRKEWVQERLDIAIKAAAMERLELRLAVYAAPPKKPPDELRFSREPFRVVTLADASEALDFVGGRT